ncbi:MAG: ferritin family protein [Verrucomicrobiota bacterium]
MALTFSANEVFEIAEQIERNGAAFYRKAADLHPTQHNKNFLLKLAAMEDDHLKIFQAMRKALSAAEREPTSYDPMDESLMYLQTMANMHGGEGSPDVSAKLTGKESMRDILWIAMRLETKSILFYLGMKDMVPEKLGRDKLDVIIKEEKSHIVVLSKELKTI